MTDDELKRLLDANGAELRRHFDVVVGENRHLFQTTAEGLRHEIQQVAEGVAATRERQGVESREIREEIQHGFADTQAMIKFSHAELDRRVHALEEGQRSVEQTLSEVQARIERLERSTQ